VAGTAAKTAPSFAERLSLLVGRVSYKRAETDEDRAAIFRLRYEAYLREGAIPESYGRSYSDKYDDLENAWIVGTYIDRRLASSFRLHVASINYPDMPANQVFKDFLDPYVAAGKTIVDPTRFVVDQEMAALVPELPYLTVRIGHMAAEYFNADIVLATVRAEHQAFYKRVFGHHTICEPRPYPGLMKPISLMLLDYPAEREQIIRRYPFFASTHAERAALFGEPPPGRPRQVASVPATPGDAVALVG
jgi:N-acyl-L-homoserine lactone synthetase